MILKEIEHQAKQGVDYMTVHAGVLQEHLRFVEKRLIGIVSRGGSLLAKWMIEHGKQNPMYTLWGDICEILTRRNSKPKKDWLKVVKTARARSKIRHYLREKGTAA